MKIHGADIDSTIHGVQINASGLWSPRQARAIANVIAEAADAAWRAQADSAGRLVIRPTATWAEIVPFQDRNHAEPFGVHIAARHGGAELDAEIIGWLTENPSAPFVIVLDNLAHPDDLDGAS